jgi:hypothetical protein
MIPNWIKAAWHFQGIGAQQRSWPFSIENDRGRSQNLFVKIPAKHGFSRSAKFSDCIRVH